MISFSYNFIDLIDPFSANILHEFLTGVTTDNPTKITDFQLFMVASVFILILGSSINRPVYKILVRPYEHPKNYRVDELPILFKVFPICFFFIYDVSFCYTSQPTAEIVRFTLPFQLSQLKWYTEILYSQIARRGFTEEVIRLEIQRLVRLDVDTYYSAQRLERTYLENDYESGLYTKMGTVLKIFLPTYKIRVEPK